MDADGKLSNITWFRNKLPLKIDFINLWLQQQPHVAPVQNVLLATTQHRLTPIVQHFTFEDQI
jgi:hypothetical protein